MKRTTLMRSRLTLLTGLGGTDRSGRDRPGAKVTADMPSPVTIRQEPFERTSVLRGETWNRGSPPYINNFFAREFWRFVMVQQYVTKLALAATDHPPMQAPATFYLDAVRKRTEKMIKRREGQQHVCTARPTRA